MLMLKMLKTNACKIIKDEIEDAGIDRVHKVNHMEMKNRVELFKMVRDLRESGRSAIDSYDIVSEKNGVSSSTLSTGYLKWVRHEQLIKQLKGKING